MNVFWSWIWQKKIKKREFRLLEQFTIINEIEKGTSHVVVTEELSDNGLVQDLLHKPQEEEDTEDNEHETVITTEEATNSIKKPRHYFQQEDYNTDIIFILNKVKLILETDYVNKIRIQKQK